MPEPRPFRFGLQLTGAEPDTLTDTARRAEDAGFDVLHTADHLGRGWPPLIPLAAVAMRTQRLRLCPLVLNNDLHHPVRLAQELAAVDLLSEGRLEVGLGAGHAFTEYAAAGLTFDPPAMRKRRLVESLRLLRRLLDGEEVHFDGEFYQLDGAAVLAARQRPVPLMAAVNGRRALAAAVPLVDIVGLAMLGRTLPDGHDHAVRWQPELLDEVVGWIREAPGGRDVELQALVQAVSVTDDRRAAAEQIAAEAEGLSAADALATPFLCLGSHDEIAAQLLAARRRWGISYYSVRSLDGFAPVIERLRREDGQ